jgi:uncharacterized protein YndB with AHSA1/START domain
VRSPITTEREHRPVPIGWRCAIRLTDRIPRLWKERLPMKATTTRRFFSRETEVAVDIAADADAVWSLLTSARDYPSWNSTVVSIEGDIARGNTIRLTSTLDPKRTFKLSVKQFDPPERLVWGDAMGTRTYRITPKGPGSVTFSMHEKIGGPVFPLFAGMIPSFDASFDTFAADLKKKAEGRS